MSDTKGTKTNRAPPPAHPGPAPAPAVESLPPAQMLAPKALLPVPLRRTAVAGDALLSACRARLASISESQRAVASDFTAMALALTGLTHSNLTAAGDSFTALFTARSLVDAVEIQLGFTRRSLDAIVDGSTKLGEIGLRLANDAAKPMLAPFAPG